MNFKKLLHNSWLHICLTLVVGLVIGALATRWHYKKLYKDSVVCGSNSYYDRTGKIKLYSESSCLQ